MRVHHPNAVRDTTDNVDGVVDIAGSLYEVGEDGTLSLAESEARALAERYGLTLSDVRVGDAADVASDAPESDAVCGVEMSDGSTCERPASECPYH